jgi:hypothetical protein
MSNWREEWESHADAEAERYDATSVSGLVDEISRGRFGEYHTIWYSLARRAAPAEAAKVLLGVLESDRPYLDRYHCATALLQILGCSEFRPEALSADRFPLAQNLARVRSLVEGQTR